MEIQFEQTVVERQSKPLRLVDLIGKKHCRCIVEVNFAPSKPIPEGELKSNVFLVTWEDGSQAEYQLIDIMRFTLNDYYSFLTIPSHGMDFFDFLEWFRNQYPTVNSETKMAAYFYQKVMVS